MFINLRFKHVFQLNIQCCNLRTMSDNSKTHGRDLEERTEKFAKMVRSFIKKLPRWFGTIDDARQLMRSSGSVAANYSEAQSAISRRDFIYRTRICKKEIRESILWLRLLDNSLSSELELKRNELVKEAEELTAIFTAINKKVERNVKEE